MLLQQISSYAQSFFIDMSMHPHISLQTADTFKQVGDSELRGETTLTPSEASGMLTQKGGASQGPV